MTNDEIKIVLDGLHDVQRAKRISISIDILR